MSATLHYHPLSAVIMGTEDPARGQQRPRRCRGRVETRTLWYTVRLQRACEQARNRGDTESLGRCTDKKPSTRVIARLVGGVALRARSL